VPESARIDVATPADGPAIVALLAQAGLPTADLTPAALAGFLAAHDGDALVGAITVERHGDDGLLRSLVVAPAQRGRGLGRALVQAVEQRAREQGLRSLALLTQSATEFFAARGYRVVPRSAVAEALRNSTQFAGVSPASATCMEKNLLHFNS
jgi:amino-acid N-acetyltransferase